MTHLAPKFSSDYQSRNNCDIFKYEREKKTPKVIALTCHKISCGRKRGEKTAMQFFMYVVMMQKAMLL